MPPSASVYEGSARESHFSSGHLLEQVQPGPGAQSPGQEKRPGRAGLLWQLAIRFPSRFTESPSLGEIFTPSTLRPPMSPPNSRK